jgi:titin
LHTYSNFNKILIYFSFLFIEKPLSFNKKLTDQDVIENGSATFECALSKPDVKAEWLFNGKPIADVFDKDSYVISEIDGIHRLHIPKCMLKHQGNYSLRVPSENLETKARLGVDGLSLNFFLNTQ